MNKSPTVCNDVEASSFEIWTANMAQSLTVGTLTNSWSFIFGDSNWKFCKVGYLIGPQNLTFRCRHFWLGIIIFYDFIFEWKKSKPVGYTSILYLQMGGKYQVNWNFVWCLLLIFDAATSLRMGFCSRSAVAGLGPSGLRQRVFTMKAWALSLRNQKYRSNICNKNRLSKISAKNRIGKKQWCEQYQNIFYCNT